MITQKDVFIGSNGPTKNSKIYLEYNKSQNINHEKHGFDGITLDVSLVLNYIKNDHLRRRVSDETDFKILFIGNRINLNEMMNILSSQPLTLKEIVATFKLEYITLVNNEEVYRWLSKQMEESELLEFLKSINDIGVNFNIIKNKRFINRYSKKNILRVLISTSENVYSFENGYKHLKINNGIVYKLSPPEKITIFNEDNQFHSLSLENEINVKIPFHVLIGKNGSGKTYLLSNMIKKYFNVNYDNYMNRELFSRIITISNTINDECYYPSRISRNKSIRNNYYFISLTKKKQYNNFFRRGRKISLISLINEVKERDNTKEGQFKQSVLLDMVTKKIIPDYSFSIKTNTEVLYFNNFMEYTNKYGLINLNIELDNEIEASYIIPDTDITFYNNDLEFSLSSGQLSFLMTMFSIISTIESNSLIVLEEPENFLHPSLLTHFINILTHILRDTNSIAVIATHSALVLREVPSSQVTILSRINNKTNFQKSPIETFSEDTHQIMINIFGDLYSNAIFREEIKKMAESKDIDELFKKYKNLPSEIISKIIFEAAKK